MNITGFRALFAISIVLLAAVSAYPSGPGSLDLTFAGTGYRYDLPSPFTHGSRAAVQPDGRIVTAAYVSMTFFTLVRYNPDGSRDTTFGADGSVAGGAIRPTALILQPDGKILVAGGGTGSDTTFGLARYNPDGSPDTSFDGDGTVRTQVLGSSAIMSAAIQSDGKIVVTGRAYNFSEFRYYFALVRYNTDGSLDTSFDGDGIVTTTNLNATYGSSVAIQPDGKIVASGTADESGGPTAVFTLTRYNPNGSIDTTFDGDGVVKTPMLPNGGVATSIVLLADGRVVAGGQTSSGPPNTEDFDFVVARYNPDGSLDTSFDGDGKAITPVLSAGDFLSQIVVQADGKIVAAGSAENGTNLDMALVRYNTDGSLDSDYGTGGRAVFDLGDDEGINGIALDGMGKAIAIGSQRTFLIARITADFAPLVEVGGRVTSTNGQAIGNARLVLTDENNISQYALTNPFGYYVFSGVRSNETYVVRASAKRYRVHPPTQTIAVTATVWNVDFVGDPGGSRSESVVTKGEKVTSKQVNK